MKRVLFQPTISYSEVIISIQNKLNAILKELLPSEIEFSQKEEINFEIQNILKEHFKSSVKINQSPSLNGNILLITFAMNIEYNDVFYLNKHFIIDGEVRVDFLSEDNDKFIDLNQFTLTYNVTNNEKEFMKEVFQKFVKSLCSFCGFILKRGESLEKTFSCFCGFLGVFRAKLVVSFAKLVEFRFDFGFSFVREFFNLAADVFARRICKALNIFIKL